MTEWLVSLVYTLTGEEDIRVARILGSIFWLAGGWFLFRLAGLLVSTEAAVAALAYYLFMPMSVLLSRSFQPDALMMLMFLASLLATARYHEGPSGGRLALASLLAALTVLHRPIVLFGLVGSFAVPRLLLDDPRKARTWKPILVYGLTSVLPALVYYAYETIVAGRFSNQLEISFQPHLWGQPKYWAGWLELAVWTAGVPALVASVIGFRMLGSGLPRAMLAGLALGYVVFGLLFTMHIHTHGYYHAQLIPLVGIASSPVVVLLVRWLAEVRLRWLKWLTIAALAGLAVLWWRHDVNEAMDRPQLIPEAVAREIGALVQHSDRVVFVARYYGVPLQYRAELTGTFWPRSVSGIPARDRPGSPLTVAERLDGLGFDPEYFVITFFREYERNHRDLAEYLEGNCVLKARTDRYLVYERCRPLSTGVSDSP